MTITEEKIKAEVEEKGYKFISAEGYKNLTSDIIVECPHGHKIQTSRANFRAASFTCPQCDCKEDFHNPTKVPEKTGYRVIAFDQATERFGLSVFDDGKLVFFNLYTFNGLVNNRISQAKQLVEFVIKNWKPNYIVMEDIQYQYGNVMTYKILAMLLGVIETVCYEAGQKYEVVSPNVWRKYCGTCGKTRTEEKQLSIAFVKEKYNIRVSDDVAEAILIGRYGAMNHKIEMAF